MIEVDVSIELYLPNSKELSMLWIFECKDYNKSIPVDDVEELNSKRDQIASANSKAILVTKGSLQKSALNFARYKGIAVIRLFDNNKVKWELPFGPPSNLSQVYEVITALTDPNFKASTQNFYGCDGNYIYYNLASLLEGENKSIGVIPNDLTYILPKYVRTEPPSKVNKKLQNRLLYKHIQRAYEHVRSKQVELAIQDEIVQNVYLQPLASVFSPVNAEPIQNQQLVVSTGTAESFFRSELPSIPLETQERYIYEFQDDLNSIISQLGTEAYALYLPIHFFFSGSQFDTDWGIYISEAGIAKVAYTLKKHCYKYFGESKEGDRADAIFTQIAYQILLRHELFHFKVEFFALNSEIILGRPLYVPYIQSVYAPTQYTDMCLEEAFANSSVLNSGVIGQMFQHLYSADASNINKINLSWRKVIEQEFFKVQPKGYNNYNLERGWPKWYDMYTGLKQRQRAMNYLCNQILSSQIDPKADSIPFYAFPPDNYFLRSENLVPINIVRTLSSGLY